MNRRPIVWKTSRPSPRGLPLALILAIAGIGLSSCSDAPAADEEPRHTNRLADETSPYLLQHAHNPVDWHPWGEEAFEKARRENKPIFLSVGYSTCYWCHVMERESFEDEQVASVLNRHFIPIKVDREERPDVDEQYMLATQLLTGRGGWPNSVWLTPDGRPWMAGTYFPRRQFLEVLRRSATIWETGRERVEDQAERLAAAIRQVGSGAHVTANAPLSRAMVDRAIQPLHESYDEEHGGFAVGQMKFPPHGSLRLLAQEHRRTGDPRALEILTGTLDAMERGGIHDHIGGGFHRYATDRHWLLPHFEKMLYDNAQLIRAYTDGYLLTGRERYRDVVDSTFHWLQREMTGSGGAFYSAIDAEVDAHEGRSYLWDRAEVLDVLGDTDGELFIEVYNFEKRGNFIEEATGQRPGTNIPHRDRPIERIAAERGEDPERFKAALAAMHARLLAERDTRDQPHLDDKVLTSWNGLMIEALAYAGRHLDEPRYTDAAADAADFILQHLTDADGRLLRVYRAGEAKLDGYLDDHAYFALGLVELHEATGDPPWLDHARQLADAIIEDFEDQANGGFFFTSERHDQLITRSKNLIGGGNVPTANGSAAQLMLRLADLTGEARYADAAERTLDALSGAISQNPGGAEALTLAVATHIERRAAATALADDAEEQPPTTTPRPEPDARREADPVTIDAFLSRLTVQPGDTLLLAVAIDIPDGWHLYAPGTDLDFLIPTTVTLADHEHLAPGDIEAPEPQRRHDAALDETVDAYSGRILFRLPVTVAPDTPPGPLTLDLQVRTQACDDTRCLLPQNTTLRLPVIVDPDAPDERRHDAIFRPR